jgi:hypothetical protein
MVKQKLIIVNLAPVHFPFAKVTLLTLHTLFFIIN